METNPSYPKSAVPIPEESEPPPIPTGYVSEPARLIPVEREHRTHRRHRHGYETHFRTGKIWLIAIFCLLRVVDGIFYLNAYIWNMKLEYVHSAALVIGLWSTSLLVAMWLRHGWARYCLAAILFALSALQLWIITDLFVKIGTERMNLIPLVAVTIQASIGFLLIFVKPIRRLTNRSYA